MLSEAMRDKSKAMTDAFKHFVQTFSALIGGGIALRLAYGADKMKAYETIFNWLLALGGLVFIILIIENHRSWLGYRRKLHEIAGRDQSGNPLVSAPNPRADLVPALYCLVIAVAVAMAIISTPLD